MRNSTPTMNPNREMTIAATRRRCSTTADVYPFVSGGKRRRMLLIVVGAAGGLVGAGVCLLAKRWPQIEAPKLATDTIAVEVVQHPKLADHFRRHFDPRTETGVALSVAVALVVGAAVGIGVLLAMIRARLGFDSIDLRLARYGAEHSTAFTTEVLRSISLLGGTTGV